LKLTLPLPPNRMPKENFLFTSQLGEALVLKLWTCCCKRTLKLLERRTTISGGRFMLQFI
jgi:hypothetical protein